MQGKPVRRPVRRNGTNGPGGSRQSTAPTDVQRRFRELDGYRVEREWRRYEGTAQRRLFRELRKRFLERHRVRSGWALDLGSGPGRFLPHLGGAAARRVALDLSREMLSRIPAHGGIGGAEAVRGDGFRPPFAAHAFAEVVALGNVIGFAGDRAEEMLGSAFGLTAPGGRLIVELVAGPGEKARYLARTPASELPHLFHAPLQTLRSGIEREGFALEPARRRDPGGFRRGDPRRVVDRARAVGAAVREAMAVAPLLGADAARVAAIAADPAAWSRLLALEEEFGRRAERHPGAAAILLAIETGPLETHD